MNANTRLLLISVILFLLDLPWLSLINKDYSETVKKIQGGSEVRMRPLAGIIVYPALAFLSLKTKSLKDAFFTGIAVYAVYDFTVFAAFKEYPLWIAVADTLWGGILFTAIHYIINTYNL